MAAVDSPSAPPPPPTDNKLNSSNQVIGDDEGHGKVTAKQQDNSADLHVDDDDNNNSNVKIPAADMPAPRSHRSANSVGSATGDKLKNEPIDIELQLRDTEASRINGALGPKAGDGRESVAEGQVTDYRTYRRRWFGLVQLTLLNIVVSWDWLTFAPVASSAASYYSTSETNINWLSTAFLFAFVVISPVVIRVLHWGPKPSIMTAATLVLIGNWIRYGGSHSSDGGIFGVVMFGQILTGLAQPFVLAAPTRYSDLWFTNRGRVGATAIMSLANPFGAALGQLIVPFMVEKPADMSQGVLYVAIISTVCCIPAYFIPAAPPTPVAPSSETEKLPLLASARTAFRSLELWLILIPFSFYVGFFNSASSLLNQMLTPYGITDDEAGIGGALLIVVGLVTAAITSPILDRTKKFLLAIKIAVPVIGVCYLAFIWMPETAHVEGPYVVLAILGASSFGLVPIALEYLIELSHPISPEVTSVVAWAGGQLLGGCFILISDALQAGDDASPPRNMKNALIFQAVLALVVVPLPLCLGLFGRADKVVLRRVRSDEEGARRAT